MLPDMSDLYDDDILLWSERQAALLRQAAAEPRTNQPTPDWANIIEEIEAVGRSELNAVRSLLVQALLHDLKCAAWPQAPYVPHWQAEARGFRDDAADGLTPSMRHRIDLADLYRKALHRMPATTDGQPPLPVPSACPVTLDDLLKTP
jgi:hypothetical protein